MGIEMSEKRELGIGLGLEWDGNGNDFTRVTGNGNKSFPHTSTAVLRIQNDGLYATVSNDVDSAKVAVVFISFSLFVNL